MEIQGVGGMDKDMQEIAAVHAALQTLKTQLTAYQSNPNSLQNLVAAYQALTAASQLPLPPGQSYLSGELQSAMQLMTTLGNLPVTIPSCSTSYPNALSVRDNDGNPINLAELANHPEYTYNFHCRIADSYSFQNCNWATHFTPGFNPGDGNPYIPSSVATASGVTGSTQEYTCHNYIDISGSATGTQINSLGGVQMNATASNQISTFLNSII